MACPSRVGINAIPIHPAQVGHQYVLGSDHVIILIRFRLACKITIANACHTDYAKHRSYGTANPGVFDLDPVLLMCDRSSGNLVQRLCQGNMLQAELHAMTRQHGKLYQCNYVVSPILYTTQWHWPPPTCARPPPMHIHSELYNEATHMPTLALQGRNGVTTLSTKSA